MTLQGYLRHRRAWEAGLFVAFLFVNWVANTAVAWTDVRRANLDFRWWEVATWEGTSVVVLLALVPAIIAFDARFPLRRETFRANLLLHLLFSIPFSLVHVLGMVGLRKLVYRAAGRSYDFGDWPPGVLYEYLKDVRTYFLLLALLYLYRFVIRRLQGEAGFLVQGTEDAESAPVSDRFLVKKLGREFLVRVADIDWIEASGNYVNLHVGERVYPLRDTMAAIEARLAAQDFVRVHRSAIVNLERIAEIVPFESGDGEIRMRDAGTVPVSRRYRKQLRERLV